MPDHVPRADVDESALVPAEGQTFCPYKGSCSYYDIGDARRAAWSYLDAYSEVRRVCGLVSFEPDKVEVDLDGTRLRLEPGQGVIPHGSDRDLSADEMHPENDDREADAGAASSPAAARGRADGARR